MQDPNKTRAHELSVLSEERTDASRFLLYSHDGQGLGHTRRNLAVASALADLCPNAGILLVSGTDEVHRLGLSPHVGVLKLPGLRKVGNDEYDGRRLRIP